MFNKFIVALIIGSSLIGPFAAEAAIKKKPVPIQNQDFKAGDVIAVEMNILGKKTIVLVYVHSNGTADYMHNGKLYPFSLATLDSFVWAYYIKK